MISAADAQKHLGYADCIGAVEWALKALTNGDADMPLRFGYKLPTAHFGILASMPAFIKVSPLLAAVCRAAQSARACRDRTAAAFVQTSVSQWSRAMRAPGSILTRAASCCSKRNMGACSPSSMRLRSRLSEPRLLPLSLPACSPGTTPKCSHSLAVGRKPQPTCSQSWKCGQTLTQVRFAGKRCACVVTSHQRPLRSAAPLLAASAAPADAALQSMSGTAPRRRHRRSLRRWPLASRTSHSPAALSSRMLWRTPILFARSRPPHSQFWRCSKRRSNAHD